MAGADNGREKQRELYGEPLNELATRIMTGLSLTQARLAEILGLSAPMLSQLLSGQRIKIGNPAVLARLQAIAELAEHRSRFDPDELTSRLAAIREDSPTIAASRGLSLPLIQRLRAAAPAAELARLAELTTAPRLADLLRTASEHG